MDNDIKVARQNRLDSAYKTILILLFVALAAAIAAIFGQIYNINTKIDAEVKQISSAQEKNHLINNQQNNVVLGYLICIATVQPANRTPAIINACVAQAEKSNPISNQ